MTDRQALRILFSKYWSPSEGWQDRELAPSDFAYAKRHGVMLDPRPMDHDAAVEGCRKALAAANREKIVGAFISSLGSRDLAHRSALSSFAANRWLPKHSHQEVGNNPFSDICAICGERKRRTEIDVNVLSFERHKFGGVRHSEPSFAMLDLEWFASPEPPPLPAAEESALLWRALEAIQAPGLRTLGEASRCLGSILRSNKNERDGFLSALGFCGVLSVPEYPDLHRAFTPFAERKASSYAKSDWPFPADLWRPEFGLNEEAIEEWFGGCSVANQRDRAD